MPENWPQIEYQEALDAYEAGQKLHRAGRIFLVRPVPRPAEQPAGTGLVLWVTDQETLGHHGLLLYPDGRTEAR